MIRKTLLLTIFTFTLFACSDNKKQEKSLLNEVIKAHDKLMTDDGVIMQEKMQLKTIAATHSSLSPTDSSGYYTKLLNNADDRMMNWMNKFNPDFSGSHEQIMTYLDRQKKEIEQLDAQINSAITTSKNYINKTKAK